MRVTQSLKVLIYRIKDNWRRKFILFWCRTLLLAFLLGRENLIYYEVHWTFSLNSVLLFGNEQNKLTSFLQKKIDFVPWEKSCIFFFLIHQFKCKKIRGTSSKYLLFHVRKIETSKKRTRHFLFVCLPSSNIELKTQKNESKNTRAK